MSKSLDGLKAAFAGESQANKKYTAFAADAEKKGYAQAAKLFRAAAEAEKIHALNHFKAMKGIGSVEENLESAIAGENYEVTEMYPEFIEYAETEEDAQALRTFKWALEVEKEHKALYTQMLENLESSKDEDYDFYVCPICGSTHPKSAPDKCPVCNYPGDKFIHIA